MFFSLSYRPSGREHLGVSFEVSKATITTLQWGENITLLKTGMTPRW